MVIDYNRFPVVAGAGSAFFLHVTNNQPTAGCVAISAYALNVVMRWLDPALHPVISIGVGAQATKLITDADNAAATHNPRGHLDSVSTGHGTAKVVGWAADPDSPSSALQVSVYFDHQFRGRYSTGVARPDVAAAIHAGPNQGFSISFGTVAAGVRTICVVRDQHPARHHQPVAGLPDPHGELSRSRPVTARISGPAPGRVRHRPARARAASAWPPGRRRSRSAHRCCRPPGGTAR